jgi:hypothetical protein
MRARFDPSYVKGIIEAKDQSKLYHLLSILEKNLSLPDELWLSLRLQEWSGSDRSGVWEYYEGVSTEKFAKMHQALAFFGLREIADKYSLGMAEWNNSHRCDALEKWLWSNDTGIVEAIFNLAISRKEWLYENC